MYATENRVATALTAPAALALWWGAATALTAWCVRGFALVFAVPVTAVAAVAAGILVLLIARRSLQGNRIRVLAYVCAFVATQGNGVFNAVVAMTPGIRFVPRPFGAWVLVEVLGGAALTVWTFFLVRAWVIGHLPARSATRGTFARLCTGCAVAAASLVVLMASNIAYNTLVDAFAMPNVAYPMNMYGAEQWMVMIMALALAGVAEEPVFVGVAVLLWPRLPGRTFVGVWALTSLARAGIHLYYAAGAGIETPAAVVLVVLWCGAWSGFNLFLVYRTRRLWPVMLAHGLQNTFGAAAGLAASYVTTGEEAVLGILTLAILGTVAFIAIGTLSFVAMGTRRLWAAQVKGRNCPLVQTPQWPPDPQSHQTIG